MLIVFARLGIALALLFPLAVTAQGQTIYAAPEINKVYTSELRFCTERKDLSDAVTADKADDTYYEVWRQKVTEHGCFEFDRVKWRIIQVLEEYKNFSGTPYWVVEVEVYLEPDEKSAKTGSRAFWATEYGVFSLKPVVPGRKAALTGGFFPFPISHKKVKNWCTIEG